MPIVISAPLRRSGNDSIMTIMKVFNAQQT